MAREQIEREDKYDVPPDFVLPALSDVVPDGTIETHQHHLEATYFDTVNDDLRRHAIALRRRTGGHDAGWHLKLAAEAGRTEISVESTAGATPRELTALLLGVRRGQRLLPRAKLSTMRHSEFLRDERGGLVAEVSDDLVRAERLGDAPSITEWREIEVELGPDADEAVLDRVGEVLVKAGARPSDSSSKFARAMGLLPHRPRPEGLAGLVDDYLQAQYAAIVAGDVGLRREQNLIHPTRVAIRRVRSTLRVFRALFDRQQAQQLEAELAWFAGRLGAVRDLDVQRPRLSEQLAALPAELVVGPVASELEAGLAADRAEAWRQLRKAMNGKRYLALLNQLERWRTDPPSTAAAACYPERVADFVTAADEALHQRLRLAADRGTDDELFHSARKAAKRYRYANELAAPVLGKRASRATEQTKELQTLLGEHQDSVVSAALLRRLGTRADNGFTYGVLLAQQQEITERTRAAVTASSRGQVRPASGLA